MLDDFSLSVKGQYCGELHGGDFDSVPLKRREITLRNRLIIINNLILDYHSNCIQKFEVRMVPVKEFSKLLFANDSLTVNHIFSDHVLIIEFQKFIEIVSFLIRFIVISDRFLNFWLCCLLLARVDQQYQYAIRNLFHFRRKKSPEMGLDYFIQLVVHSMAVPLH